ncbi:hypothetical protein LR48_Vigan45s002200 [Vigna angularis]|uniref:Uncharacterized protein n=2 Tax=Phaseolus angularis TaxID=3914 RepID=A0A0L9T353_PHAAN|nr:hypothetical protein LR48_Vigan45s002200 [Vigna angularis]BAT74160.1 hypothetical protein VIGAN_01177000 [Vigna angularis var. angularis]
MGSECNKWMILAFVIAISFSVMMEGALAARQLMQLSNPFNPFDPLCFAHPGCVKLIPSSPPPPGGSTSTVP